MYMLAYVIVLRDTSNVTCACPSTVVCFMKSLAPSASPGSTFGAARVCKSDFHEIETANCCIARIFRGFISDRINNVKKPVK